MPCAPAPSPSTGTCTPTRLLEADPSPAGCRAGRRGQPPQVPGLRTLPRVMGLPWPRDLPRCPVTRSAGIVDTLIGKGDEQRALTSYLVVALTG